MALCIYNTLNNKKEIFEPIEKGVVKMYVCGPTVYDSCHIGHARSVVVFDVIARYLTVKRFKVTYVRNFTDVDDKIINRANELEESPESIAEKYISEFYNDMDALNIQRATMEPRATDHIEQIIEVIKTLIEKGYAYQMDGDVFFKVDAFKEYGKLSGRKLEDMEAGARVAVDKRKKSPFDFALWKAKKPGEPFWKSPWGEGRPGWHIECSAMSTNYLGKTFDIHGGGKDLIFPHHENEIAQSEAAFERPFAKYWVHNGFVNIDHEKMSKSLGNFLMIKDVLDSYHPDVIRLFLLSNHYRSPIDFTTQAMEEAQTGLNKIYTLMARVEKEVQSADIAGVNSGSQWERFCEAMDDDFNTAHAIGILFETVRKTNSHLDVKVKDIKPLQTYQKDIFKMADVLGILTDEPDEYFKKLKNKAVENQAIDSDLVERLIEERSRARKDKDWNKADKIRKRLEEMRIILEDRPDETIWKIETE